MSNKVRTRTVTLAVTLEMPEKTNLRDVTDYVRSAVQDYGPNSTATIHYTGPMTTLNPETVKVRVSNLTEKTNFPAGGSKRG